MKYKYIIVLISYVSCFGFYACNDANLDTQKPIVTIISPQNDDSFNTGSSQIHIRAEFSDNESLSSCKLEIHSNSDHHGEHKSLKTEDNDNHGHDHTNFYVNKIYELNTEKYQLFEDNISIPHAVNGNMIEGGEYHLSIHIVDAAGNESVAYRTIYLVETE